VTKALYRKYRSKKLSEIVGQEHITRTLDQALKNGRISHAYLFTGPRGVGKTSIARILAHEINGLPYNDDSNHLDIIEIDAASNRRIDEIRDLREKVYISPASSKFKVYIIDEVHMLTKEAFNALLKTLEEPPAHVVFILATTEVHKLPETIISRTQRFTFKPVEGEEAVRHLRFIADEEGIDIDDEALALIVQHGRGSFRDSISLLDQIGHSQITITKAYAETLIGLAPEEHITKLLRATLNGIPADIIIALNQLVNDGAGAAQIAKQMSAQLRQRLLDGAKDAVIPELLADLIKVIGSNDPQAQLEVALFKANLNSTPIVTDSSKADTKAVSESATVSKKTSLAKIAGTTPSTGISQPKTEANNASFEEWWSEVLQHIKTINNTLYGILRMAHPRLEGDNLQLLFGFSFHQKKITDASTRAKVIAAIKKITGNDLKIEAIHDKSLSKAPEIKLQPIKTSAKMPAAASDLSSITNIFGGGEVLEV
jgi:DNA polymerase III subunit gamma/tau